MVREAVIAGAVWTATGERDEALSQVRAACLSAATLAELVR